MLPSETVLIEAQTVDAIVKKVIAKIVEELVREAIARLVGADDKYSTGLANEARALFLREIEALIAKDDDVKEALKKRLIAELNKKSN